MAMSDDLKRWLGSGGVAVGLVAVLAAGWWFVAGSGGGGGKHGASETSALPTPTSTPSSAVSSPSPSASPTYINAAPGETPPARPPDELSDAGLEAFVRYFAQAGDWAGATMDPTLLQEASASSCGGCASVISGIRKDLAEGHRLEGGRYTVTRVMAFPNVSGDETRRDAGFWWDSTAYTVYAADGSVIQQDPPESDVEHAVSLRFINGRWSVISLQLVKRAG